MDAGNAPLPEIPGGKINGAGCASASVFCREASICSTVETSNPPCALEMTLLTPNFSASTSNCGEQCMVHITTATLGSCVKSSRAAANPSSAGMTTSKT